MTKAGVKRPGLSAHALRRTAASNILGASPDLRVAQLLLGHASVATTNPSLRPASVGHLREVMRNQAATGSDTMNGPSRDADRAGHRKHKPADPSRDLRDVLGLNRTRRHPSHGWSTRQPAILSFARTIACVAGA